MSDRSLMVITAHPDDETLGFGGTIARYASEGVDITLVTATRGDRGRWRGIAPGSTGHPGAPALARMREAELRQAAAVLGVRTVAVLGHPDGHLDQVDPQRLVSDLVGHVRRARPAVVLTFGPDGAYGHPDHIAVSQSTLAAVLAASDSTYVDDGQAPHAVSKVYFLAWPASAWAVYQAAFKRLVSTVDGLERQAVPWPDWAITTSIDTRHVAARVHDAVLCHASQTAAYRGLLDLSSQTLEQLWGQQSFYRALSTVNGGRATERDIFEGIRHD
jgi:LmbE family N-acetylglucosaminyl deacetylase